MVRFRELIPIQDHLPTGRFNAISDVAGIKVGHTTLIRGEDVRTGVTAILPHSGDIFREKVPAAIYTINGYGKATGFEQIRHLGVIESPICLTNTLNIGLVWDAVVAYMLQQNEDIGLRTGTLNPVVGECNDSYLNTIRERHVSQSDVWAAIYSASEGLVEEGCVGAGTGTVCFGFKGGIGTASRQIVDGQYTLGVLVQTNFGQMRELQILGAPIGRHFADDPTLRLDGSIMIVIATDAPLTSRQLERIAKRAAFGLGRTGTVCHNGSGDFVIAFSTQNRRQHDSREIVNPVNIINEEGMTSDGIVIDQFFRATVECVEECVYNALVSAKTITGREGHILHALPHDKLKELLRYYRRLDE